MRFEKNKIIGVTSVPVLVMAMLAVTQSSSAESIERATSPPLVEQVATEPEEPDIPKPLQTLV